VFFALYVVRDLKLGMVMAEVSFRNHASGRISALHGAVALGGSFLLASRFLDGKLMELLL